MTNTPMTSFLFAQVSNFGGLSLAARKRSSAILDGTVSQDDAIDRIRRKRCRVLVVDDDDSYRTSMVFKLEDLYYATTVEADTGLTALDAVGVERIFDLILMDITMPGMDGIETCREMRARGITTRIVLMSAYYDAERRARAQDLGITPLSKPLDPDALEMILLECAEREPDE